MSIEYFFQNISNEIVSVLYRIHQSLPLFAAVILVIFLCILLVLLKLQPGQEHVKAFEKKRENRIETPAQVNTAPQHYLDGIASDDEVATQLDLARAYIEMNKLDMAKSILGQVVHSGDVRQQHEAKRLLASL